MSRRTTIIILSVCLLVFTAGFSTARAKQLLDTQAAQQQLARVQLSTRIQLEQAARQGLDGVALKTLASRLKALGSQTGPSASALWDMESAAFYAAQASKYRRLTKQIGFRLAAEKTLAYTQSGGKIQSLAKRITAAAAMDVATDSPQAVLRSVRERFRRAHAILEFRRLSSIADRATVDLGSLVSVRAREVSAVERRTGNSQQSMVAEAIAIGSNEHEKLALMSLLSPAGSAGHDLDAAVRAVAAQSQAHLTAVKIVDLQLLEARTDAAYARTVPAQLIVISTENQAATMYDHGRQIYNTPVTTGGPELPTDRGVFHIYLKVSPFVFHSPWPPGSPYYYPPTPISYWMPFDGAQGLHDASWRPNFGPGSNLSPTDLGTGVTILGTHGCVNLPFDAATFVWNWAAVGTTVVVD